MSQASDPSVLHSVKVPKTKSKCELLDDKLQQDRENKENRREENWK